MLRMNSAAAAAGIQQGCESPGCETYYESDSSGKCYSPDVSCSCEYTHLSAQTAVLGSFCHGREGKGVEYAECYAGYYECKNYGDDP